MAFDPLKIFKKEVPAEVEKEHLSEKIKAKPVPVRDTHGKFVSKKAVVATLQEEPAAKPQEIPNSIPANEPYTSTFYGVDIKKYYDNGKWYFSIEDILPLGQKNPPLQSLDKLKENEEFNKVFEKAVKIIDNIPCSEAKGIVEIVNLTGASFPGPFQRWIEETAAFPFEEPAPVNPD